MSDPLNPWEEKDRLPPSGDMSVQPDTEPVDTNPEPDANDLEADNAVEADTIETLDPENPPA